MVTAVGKTDETNPLPNPDIKQVSGGASSQTVWRKTINPLITELKRVRDIQKVVVFVDYSNFSGSVELHFAREGALIKRILENIKRGTVDTAAVPSVDHKRPLGTHLLVNEYNSGSKPVTVNLATLNQAKTPHPLVCSDLQLNLNLQPNAPRVAGLDKKYPFAVLTLESSRKQQG